LRWRLEESAAVPTVAEQKKASNTARSSRCLGTARRRGSQAGGAPPRIRPINDKKLLPSDMNGCKFPTTYRQEEPRKNMIAREGGRAKKKFCASCSLLLA